MTSDRINRLLNEVLSWCKQHNVSQTELAKFLGVTPSHITEWKKGRSKPSGETALAMLEFLKKKRRLGR
jgi:DNA-binding transcriptional regulator YiaG